MNAKAIQSTWWGVAESDPKKRHSIADTASEWQRWRNLSEEHGGVVPLWTAAIVLGVSRQRVYQMCDEGKLTKVNLFDRFYLLADEVLKRQQESGD